MYDDDSVWKHVQHGQSVVGFPQCIISALHHVGRGYLANCPSCLSHLDTSP